MGIKTIYKIIDKPYRDKKGKLHNIITYTDSLKTIKQCKNEILGYKVASIDDLNNNEILDETFEVGRLKVKEGVVTYKKYFYNTLEDEYYFKDDLDENVIDILTEDESFLEIGKWEMN